MKNTSLPRLKTLLDQQKLQYVVENNVIQRVVRTKFGNFMSLFTPSGTENRISTAFYTNVEPSEKTWLDVMALLNKLNARLMIGRFALDKEQGAVIYQSYLMNISADYPDDKLGYYLMQKETSFLAMMVVLELFKRGELNLQQAGEEFARQKKDVIYPYLTGAEQH